jgi:phosphatidylglycerophosphatase A
MKEWLALFLASGCYIGLIPGAPGTYASIATTLAFFLIHQASNRIVPELHLSAICLLATAGTLASAEIERSRGIEDPQYVVIDEIAGQLIALFLVPVSLTNLILATALFRAFDIWKPYPIRRLEDLPNGVGIMADDLMAGVYANLVVHLVNWLVQR